MGLTPEDDDGPETNEPDETGLEAADEDGGPLGEMGEFVAVLGPGIEDCGGSSVEDGKLLVGWPDIALTKVAKL